MYFSNVKPQEEHIVFIGRWCPLHLGHIYIMDKKRKKDNKPILILVRDTEYDEIPTTTRAEIIKLWFLENNIRGTIIIIPDIEGVCYGRKVGYYVEELETPEDVGVISATEIRAKIKKGDATWKKLVADGTGDFIESILKKD